MKWFEIFKTGIHTDSAGNTQAWTKEDIQHIADSYDPSSFEVPLVIGHPETDAPAYGWVEALKVVGDKLMAAAKQVAPEFIDMFRKGKFKKISVCLTPSKKLRHVGFLGAAAPAVEGLATANFNALGQDIISFESDNENITVATIETLVEQVSELSLQFSKLKVQLDENADKEAKDKADADAQAQADAEAKAQAEAEAKAQADAQAEAQAKTKQGEVIFAAFLDTKTASGVITPAQKAILMNADSRSFANLTAFIETLEPKNLNSHFARKTEAEATQVSQLQTLTEAIRNNS